MGLEELGKIQRRINNRIGEMNQSTLKQMAEEWHAYGALGYGQIMRRHFTRAITGGYWSQAIDSMVGIAVGQRLRGEKVKCC